MLWIGKVKDPFTGEIDNKYYIDAQDYYEAKTELLLKIAANPFMSAVLDPDRDFWIEIADDQPVECWCYLVEASAQRFGSIQRVYVDTFNEAMEVADIYSRFYDFVEISYGFPGHWVPIEEA